MTGRIMPDFIEIRQGDNFTIRFQFRDNTNFIDISGSSLKMQVKHKADNKLVLTKNGFVDDGIKGKAHIALLPEDTKKLTIGSDYIVDIQITFANGEVHTFYPQNINRVASFIVCQNVTE